MVIKALGFDPEDLPKLFGSKELQISKYSQMIVENIINILKNYALEKQLDLILESKNYIMASNSINISDIILNEMNELKLDINFEPY